MLGVRISSGMLQSNGSKDTAQPKSLRDPSMIANSKKGRRGIGPQSAGACVSVSAPGAISIPGIGWKTKATSQWRILDTHGRRK